MRKLRKLGLLNAKGENRFAYYLPTDKLQITYGKDVDIVGGIRERVSVSDDLTTDLNALPTNLSALP